jgi:hypothetical protein
MLPALTVPCSTAHIQFRVRLNVCLCLRTPVVMQGRVRAGAWVHVWVCGRGSGSGCRCVWDAGVRVVGSDSGCMQREGCMQRGSCAKTEAEITFVMAPQAWREPRDRILAILSMTASGAE